MPTARSLIAGLALTLTAVACSDKGPTDANTVGDNGTATAAPTAPARAVHQDLIFPASQLMPGGVWTLTSIQVTHFAYDATNKLTVDAILTFSNGTTTTTETIHNAPATLTGTGAPTAATCQILTLDIGAIHLDLLGLVVDLAPVHLNITAQSGSGNLLGNLLCALTHLLDQNPLATALQGLIDQINAIIAAL
jgi:hypothetical protein